MKILKQLLPWHVRQTLGWARFYFARRKPPFEGVYARFDEVPPSPGWRADRWTESSRFHAEKWRRQIGAALPESSQPSKALLPVLVSAIAREGKPLRILDFGGAGGIDYAQLLAALGGAAGFDVRYHVVDVPESCEAGRSVWADDPRITFGSEPPGAGERFDVVYANGAVHTVEDYRGLLASFAGCRPSFMLFCKTPMHKGPSFVRRQVNMGREMENPQWALGFADFDAAMREIGYALAFRGWGEDAYNGENYPPSHRADRTANLLYRRIDAGESS